MIFSKELIGWIVAEEVEYPITRFEMRVGSLVFYAEGIGPKAAVNGLVAIRGGDGYLVTRQDHGCILKLPAVPAGVAYSVRVTLAVTDVTPM